MKHPHRDEAAWTSGAMFPISTRSVALHCMPRLSGLARAVGRGGLTSTDAY